MTPPNQARRRCGRCKQEKGLEAFNESRWWCRSCQAAYCRERRARLGLTKHRPKPVPLDATARLFLDELRATGRTENTVDTYRSALAGFSRFLAGRSYADVTQADVFAFLGSIKNVNTRQFRVIALRKFYSRLLAWGKVASNPLVGIPAPRTRRRAWTPITEEQFQQAMRAGDDTDRLLLLILYRTGARIGETCRLRAENITLNGRGGVIEFASRKGGNPGFAAFGEDLADALRSWLPTHREWVFPSGDRRFRERPAKAGPLTPYAAHTRLTRLGKRIGLHLPPHRLRHSFATFAVEAGWPQLALQQQLGHANPTSTAIYYHPSRNGLQDLYARLRPQMFQGVS